MAKTKMDGNGWLAFILVFLGSLAYLYVAYNLITAWSTPALFAGMGAVFLPIFAGVGIISAVGLFIGSFGLIKGEKMAREWSWKTTLAGAITLVALTLGNTTWVGLVLLGFILAMIGGIAASM